MGSQSRGLLSRPESIQQEPGYMRHTDEWWADSLFVSHSFERLMVPNLLVFRWWWWRGTAMLMVLNIRKHARADVEGLATRWRYKCSRVRARLNWASKSKVLPLIVLQLRLQQARIGPILQHGSTHLAPPKILIFFPTRIPAKQQAASSHTVRPTKDRTNPPSAAGRQGKN